MTYVSSFRLVQISSKTSNPTNLTNLTNPTTTLLFSWKTSASGHLSEATLESDTHQSKRSNKRFTKNFDSLKRLRTIKPIQKLRGLGLVDLKKKNWVKIKVEQTLIVGKELENKHEAYQLSIMFSSNIRLFQFNIKIISRTISFYKSVIGLSVVFSKQLFWEMKVSLKLYLPISLL